MPSQAKLRASGESVSGGTFDSGTRLARLMRWHHAQVAGVDDPRVQLVEPWCGHARAIQPPFESVPVAATAKRLRVGRHRVGCERHVAAADRDDPWPLLLLGEQHAALGAIRLVGVGQQRRPGPADHRDAVGRLQAGDDRITIAHVEDRPHRVAGPVRALKEVARDGRNPERTDHVLADRLALLDHLEPIGEPVRQRRLPGSRMRHPLAPLPLRGGRMPR